MTYLNEIIRGLILGLGEGLPVSGTGHLKILEQLGVLPEGDLFWAELGVLLAVIIAFHKTIWGMIRGFFAMIGGAFGGTFKWRKASREQIMAVYLLVAALPIIAMAILRQYIAVSGGLLFIGLMLLVSAGLIFIGSHSLCRDWTARDMKIGHAFKWGLFRAASVLPGLSSCGVSLSMGLNMGFDASFALEFSFLLTVPAILCDLVGGVGTFSLAALGGFFAAAVACFAAILLLKRLVKKERWGFLMYYCAAAGIAAVALNFIL